MTTYQFKEEESLYLRGNDGRVYYPYLPSAGLAKAVQLAIDLQRPLLLEGDPGSGKTQAAYALARQLATQNQGPEEWPFFIWNVKSSSRARAGLYEFDTLARLRDAQLAQYSQNLTTTATTKKPTTKENSTIIATTEETTAEEIPPNPYVKYGALGYAIKETQEKGLRAVLLIDEIDKGNNDFGNDLLYELEQFAFEVPEVEGDTLSYRCSENQKPIVIITSNRDKSLPDALLRRCLYYKIPFPDKDYLEEIVKLRFPEKPVPEELFEAAFDRFDDIRKAMSSPMSRKPSTSEFVDLVSVLVAKNKEQQAEILAAGKDNPYLGILIKTEDDLKLYQKYMEGQKKL
jgi:MoxR-like ATPase